ncbi:collagen-like protein [Prolixibacteraceae bacterium JC049]|nr:collagen-like protein [Prolixibacteraceae bacterium JC049]
MRHFTFLLISTIMLLMAGCEGEVGPRGPEGRPGVNGSNGIDGADGKDGKSYIGTVFEVTGDFTPDNNHRLIINYPENLEVLNSDVVFVYLLWETVEIDGKQTDVWRLLPQTRMLKQGLLQYNFDFTLKDVSVFLESNFPFDELKDGDRLNQTFRVAVLPSKFAKDKSINASTFQSLVDSPQLQLRNIK